MEDSDRREKIIAQPQTMSTTKVPSALALKCYTNARRNHTIAPDHSLNSTFVLDNGYEIDDNKDMKRETDGRYAFDGRLERMCVCGHQLANHASGSPADCLFYTRPEGERQGKPGANRPVCGCAKFRLSRKKIHSVTAQSKQLSEKRHGIALRPSVPTLPPAPPSRTACKQR